jgi:SAM-dependent methyltransferase
MNEEPTRFAFGRNWQNFVDRHLSEERIEIAQRHLLHFLGVCDLSGKRMVDIGCGSGIHSLAAVRSDVAELVSFDYDADSVAATKRLHEQSGAPRHWRVERGSVLDLPYLATLGVFDIVYSWGVLHHTGDQWTAIRNAATLIGRGGVFYVALYTADVFVDPPPEYWLEVKRHYNRSGWLGRRMAEVSYIIRNTVDWVRKGINPVTHIWNYKRSRGMSYYTDVKDWLGGWPMEFSHVEEVKRFAGDDLGLELINIATGEANAEYLFRKP